MAQSQACVGLTRHWPLLAAQLKLRDEDTESTLYSVQARLRTLDDGGGGGGGERRGDTAQVLLERKVQVESKLKNVQIDKEKQAEARHRLEAELAQVNALEKAKLDEAAHVRMQHRALLENQIKDKAFKKQAAQFNKAQERMTAERSEAAYMAMLNHQMSKTTSTMNKFAAQ